MAKKKQFLYLDANAIFPLVSIHEATDWMCEFRDDPDKVIVVSNLGQLEFISAVRKLCRDGAMTAEARDEVIAEYASLMERDDVQLAEARSEHYLLAEDIVESNPGIFPLDALHLAMALDFKDTPATAALITGDGRLRDAAAAYGRVMKVIDVHYCRCPGCGKMVRVSHAQAYSSMKCRSCGRECSPCKPRECEKYAME